MSGNASTHVWVEDATHARGGYWVRAQGMPDGSTLVTTPYPSVMTTAQRLALTATTIGYNYSVYDTDLHAEMVYIGDSVTNVAADWRYGQQYAVNGSAKVTTSVAEGLSKNRNMAAASTTYASATNGCEWVEADNVTEFYVTCTVAAHDQNDSVLMVMDGITPAAITAFFADVGGRAVDVEYVRLPYGQRVGPFQGTSWFTNLDFLPSITSTVITVEAS